MQFKVPQNIDKEDQIVGPLTLVQFSYLAIGGALDILINQTIGSALKYPVILVLSGIAVAFAFFKIQDRPLLFFISASVSYIMQPKVRVWHKVSDRTIFQMKKAAPVVQQTVARKNLDTEALKRISKVLDSRGYGENAQEQAKVAQPFANVDMNTVNKT